MTDTNLASQKAQIRRDGFARRKAARATAHAATATRHLVDYVLSLPDVSIVSAYMAIQTEIDPMAAMVELHENGRIIALPVIQGKDRPLLFREWAPDAAMIEGDFGALIPRGGAELRPDLIIAPLVAFDRAGNRMGYGGGFYDRTIAQLRKSAPLRAIGFAFAGQEVPQLPVEPTDQPLSALVTETGVITCG